MNSDSLPLDAIARIDAACDAFESAWQKGEMPRLEEFLAAADGTEHAVMLESLLALELHYRHDQYLNKEEYFQRFPKHRDIIAKVFVRGEADSGTVTDDAKPSPHDTVATPPLPEIPGYEILGILGQGGMGIVFKAVQTGLDRPVALKMILSGAHADPEQIQRFRTEAEAVARLQHANIVQIYEIGEFEGRPYFSLEFAEGGSLKEHLERYSLSPRQSAKLVEKLARAICVAHQESIVHRDLKPANILLMRNPESGIRIDGSKTPMETEEPEFRDPQSHFAIPKITDFGLAKRLEVEGHTHTGAILGTPNYMAPEQAAGKIKEIGPPADIYALGAVLYELLTGRPPFRGESTWDTLEQVLHAEPVPPRHLQPKTPKDLETICLKCLQKEKQKRYASAESLAEDLQHFLDGKPIQARRVGAPERMARWLRRKPVHAGLIVALFLLFAGAIFVLERASNEFWEHNRRAMQAQKDMESMLAEAGALAEKAQKTRDNEEQWQAQITDALSALKPAKRFMESNRELIPERLRQRLTRLASELGLLERDRVLVEELEKSTFRQARINRQEHINEYVKSNSAYIRAFRKYGIDCFEMDAAKAAVKIHARPKAVRDRLSDHFDTWIRNARLYPKTTKRQFDWLWTVARAADDDLWRNRVRTAWEDGDVPALLKLEDSAADKQRAARSLRLLGYALEHRTEIAVRLLGDAWKQYPDDFRLNFDLGFLYARLPTPDYVKGERFLSIAAALRPDNPAVRWVLGNMQARNGEYLAAADSYQRAFELNGNLVEAQENLGIILMELGKSAEAARVLRELLTKEPNRPEGQIALGGALRDHGRFAEALAAFNKGSALGPRNVSSRLAAFWGVGECGQMIKAQPKLPDLIQNKIKVSKPADYVLFAKLCYCKGRYRLSAQLWQKAFAADPILRIGFGKNQQYLASRSACQAAAGNGKDALPPNDPERKKWRMLALSWLRGNLEDHAKTLKTANPKLAAMVREQLYRWRLHDSLAPLREPGKLRSLPKDEQSAWRELWIDLAVIMERAKLKSSYQTW